MTTIILACSKSKRNNPEPMRAVDRYQGNLFRKGRLLAERNGWHIKILSAKYGLIDGNDLIPDYNTKFTRIYTGPWPEGEGFFLGGRLYFGNAPTRFRSLTPAGLSIGHMLSYMNKILDGEKPIP